MGGRHPSSSNSTCLLREGLGREAVLAIRTRPQYSFLLQRLSFSENPDALAGRELYLRLRLPGNYLLPGQVHEYVDEKQSVKYAKSPFPGRYKNGVELIYLHSDDETYFLRNGLGRDRR
ncbi:hypothetical protein AVEN_275346-1 [Araneus ventricosus]|uniref:Uncharacterized protein n=1 Tax=Araneus ventricosus TaxID=182803 RepID=A0A4Y1ZNX8_ARAVE|nr:hypothetical protein AVEN_275346-1 [Araneus ventricosus]